MGGKKPGGRLKVPPAPETRTPGAAEPGGAIDPVGTVLGAATMASSLGMASGPVIGGWVFDTFNAYNWLYVGSATVGLAAAAIALAFPPLPSRRARLQPA